MKYLVIPLITTLTILVGSCRSTKQTYNASDSAHLIYEDTTQTLSHTDVSYDISEDSTLAVNQLEMTTGIQFIDGGGSVTMDGSGWRLSGVSNLNITSLANAITKSAGLDTSLHVETAASKDQSFSITADSKVDINDNKETTRARTWSDVAFARIGMLTSAALILIVMFIAYRRLKKK
jgi:hypothetical protein